MKQNNYFCKTLLGVFVAVGLLSGTSYASLPGESQSWLDRQFSRVTLLFVSGGTSAGDNGSPTNQNPLDADQPMTSSSRYNSSWDSTGTDPFELKPKVNDALLSGSRSVDPSSAQNAQIVTITQPSQPEDYTPPQV